MPKTQPGVVAEILPVDESSMASIANLRLPSTLPPRKIAACLATQSTLPAHVAAACVARKCLLVWEAKPQRTKFSQIAVPSPSPESLVDGFFVFITQLHKTVARSPSGKAWVCKTHIGGSIPPRASKSSHVVAGL